MVWMVLFVVWVVDIYDFVCDVMFDVVCDVLCVGVGDVVWDGVRDERCCL